MTRIDGQGGKAKIKAKKGRDGTLTGVKETNQDPGGEGVGRTAVGEGVEGDLGGGVLGLAEGGAVVGALEDLAVKVDGGLEPGRVVRTFPNARVGGEVEAAPLGQLLKLVLVHFFSSPSLPHTRFSILSSPHSLLQINLTTFSEQAFLGARSDPGFPGPSIETTGAPTLRLTPPSTAREIEREKV